MRASSSLGVLPLLLLLLLLLVWVQPTKLGLGVLSDHGRAGAQADSSVPAGNGCMHYSEAYPSRGGPDCAATCDGLDSESVAAGYFNAFPPSFNARVRQAGRRIEELGPPGATTYVEGERGFMDSHITLAYYCCQTDSERSRIRRVLEGWSWDARLVRFSHVACAIDGPSDEHVSLILMLDEASNARLYREVERIERAIEEEGVTLNIRRRDQQPYHSTLAVVNGSSYPVSMALRVLNEEFLPGSWAAEPITVRKPCEAHGTTPAGFFC
jgi:hypothetical protein